MLPPTRPRIRVTTATGDDARHWVTLIGTQRTLRPLYVENLARAMVRDEWRDSNDMICFTGKLGDPGCHQVNGQHRSFALIRADELAPGIEVPVIVADGFTDDAAQTFDLGRQRSLADTLDFLEGPTQNPGHRDLAALANLAWHIRAETWANRIPAPTRIQMLQFIKENVDLLDATPYARRMSFGKGKIAGCGTAVWLMSHGSHVDRINQYVDQVATGEMLHQSDPAYVVRETILRALDVRRAGGERFVRSWWLAAILVKGWNAHISANPLTRLSFRRSEQFPEAL